MIASGIVIPYLSTHASIPAGWSRKTTLDGKYVYGAVTDGDGGGTGGHANHLHTVVNHKHTVSNHTHTVTLANGTDSESSELGLNKICRSAHGHSSTASGNPSSAVETTENSITLESIANNPVHEEVIWIESNGSPTGIPNNGGAFFDTALPAGFTLSCADKLLKGAGTGADAGGTGGVAEHKHDESGTHTHTQNAHTHASVTSSVYTDRRPPTGAGYDYLGALGHSHITSFANDGSGATGSAGVTTQNTSVEPPCRKLAVGKNTSGSDKLDDGYIALWFSTNATIPADWSRVTAQDDKFIKGFADTGDSIGDTGGSLQHTHTADEHLHTGYLHNHAGSTSAPSATAQGKDYPGAHSPYAGIYHTHGVTVGNATPTIGNTTVTVNNCSSGAALPEFLRAIFVKYAASTVTAAQVIMCTA